MAKSTSQKKEFILADGSRGGGVHRGRRQGGKQQAWWQEQEAGSSQPRPQMQTEKNASWGGYDELPYARSYLLKVPQHFPNNTTHWGPSIQVSEPVLAIQTPTTCL